LETFFLAEEKHAGRVQNFRENTTFQDLQGQPERWQDNSKKRNANYGVGHVGGPSSFLVRSGREPYATERRIRG
jgi:hypothetical protein